MQRLACAIAHECKAARQNAVIGQRGQQLAGAFNARVAPVDARERCPLGALREAANTVALARDANRMRLRVGTQSGGQTRADR